VKHKQHAYRHRRRSWLWLWLLCVLAATIVYWFAFLGGPASLYAPNFTPAFGPTVHAGDVMSVESVKSFNPPEATALIRENYGPAAAPATSSITKVTFRYRSQLPDGQFVTEFARAYVPDKPLGKLPVFGFAPGTTGIGDKCAASLEDVHEANWGNYDSHMAAYAAQGYVAVTTDYEGMRDASRIHHYMVGELEGRAVLDSVRALEHIPETTGVARLDQVFLSGYSQGGHAVFWADKIASQYAPSLKVLGVVGFGPVMSVEQTLADVTHSANINWFGPYVLYSYRDYYNQDYNLASILQPYWVETLSADVPEHCIDSDIPHWGHTAAAVYTPEFLAAAGNGKLAESYPKFYADLAKNAVGEDPSSSAKRINQGDADNVVLPAQAQAALPALCRSSKGPVQLALYPKSTHYDTMVHSFADTLEWMKAVQRGDSLPSSCHQP
jgi:hypothetical protein